jgi:hypothetical protein
MRCRHPATAAESVPRTSVAFLLLLRGSRIGANTSIPRLASLSIPSRVTHPPSRATALDSSRQPIRIHHDNVTWHWNKYDYVEIDIANILFICAGTFSDIDDHSDTNPIGFFGDGDGRAKDISTEELVKYGFLPELLGRLPVRVELDSLTADDLVTILTEPREAMIPEYQASARSTRSSSSSPPARSMRLPRRR